MAVLTFPSDARPTGDRIAISSRFIVEIDGIESATFSECSGLGMTMATDKLEEGGVNHTTRKLPGRTDFTNIVLKEGVTSTPELMEWMLKAVNGKIERKTVTVKVISEKPSTGIATWVFIRAFPVKWTGPSFQTSQNSAAIETLELAHDGFEKR
jgi:phage tail-like protein